MKQIPSLKRRFDFRLSLVFFIAGLWLVSNVWVTQADTPSEQTSKALKNREKKVEKKPEKKLGGAELYAIHCNRCHPERYATERTDAQWKTILLHMRVRANLPATDARAILKYLQEDSGK